MAEAAGLIRIGGEVSPAVMVRVREAEQALARAGFLKASAGQRPTATLKNAIRLCEVKAAQLLREAEDLARGEDETAWLEGAIAESMALAAVREEAVEVRAIPGSNAKRVLMLSRGMGLEHARDNGYLAAPVGPDRTDDLYRLGQRIRTAWEVIHGEHTHRGDGARTGLSAKGPQARVVEQGQFLAQVLDAMAPRPRAVVEAVCGQGLGMFEAARACRMGVPAARNALRGGLEAGLAAERRKPVNDNRPDLVAAHAAVAAAGRGL